MQHKRTSTDRCKTLILLILVGNYSDQDTNQTCPERDSLLIHSIHSRHTQVVQGWAQVPILLPKSSCLVNILLCVNPDVGFWPVSGHKNGQANMSNAEPESYGIYHWCCLQDQLTCRGQLHIRRGLVTWESSLSYCMPCVSRRGFTGAELSSWTLGLWLTHCQHHSCSFHNIIKKNLTLKEGMQGQGSTDHSSVLCGSQPGASTLLPVHSSASYSLRTIPICKTQRMTSQLSSTHH